MAVASDLSPVGYMELALSFFSTLLVFIVLYKLKREDKVFRENRRVGVYFNLITAIVLMYALTTFYRLTFQGMWDTHHDEQTLGCSVQSFIKFFDMIMRQWFIAFLAFEMHLLVTGTQYFEQFPVSNSEHRFLLYVCIAVVGTAIEMFCIGVFGGGFGRNAHGCSFMVTRPDGKPTFFELLTFYLMQYVLFTFVLFIQIYNCYYIFQTTSSSASAARKKRAAARKFMLLTFGVLVLWLPMVINRVEALQFPGFGELQNHSERLEGFLFTVMLLFVNAKITQTLKNILCCRDKGEGADRTLHMPLSKNLLKQHRATSLSRLEGADEDAFRLSINSSIRV